jgi:hypothetical protein
MDFEGERRVVADGWENSAFREIGVPMMKAYAAYSIGELDYACEKAEEIKAIDWRRACLDWIRKREMSLINKADKGETYE